VHEVFWITSADGSSMIYVSPAYESIWGRTCQSLYEDPSGWVRAIHSDDRDRVSRLFHDKAALGGFDTEYRVVRPDGAVRWIHDRGFPVRDENGMVYRIAGTAEDITRSKRIEEQLRASQALHQSLIDHLPDLIMVKDAQGRFLTANPALVHALGLSDLRDLLGRTDWDFFSPELAGQYARDEQTILSTGVPMLNHEERCIIGGRQVWNLTTKVPLLDAAGRTTGLVGITRDITESKRQRQALEETAAALERSNAELQQFAYVASHDLQEPLRMISSYCQLLERRYKGRLDEQADKFIAYAVDGARRMQTLIRDLLAYSRVETSPRQMAAVDLNQAAALALANLAMLLQDSQAKVTIEPLPTVSGDRTLLTQLLQNLINNAIKFRGDRTPEVHVSSQPQGDFHRITVRDNGIGIAQEHHAKVFQIFKRLHSREQYEGTGIGLAVCKRVVEKHGGEIWIESTPGQGSAFHFTLRPPPPNASPEPTPESPNASPTPEPA
jgi:PAS domain S-box-containing protein